MLDVHLRCALKDVSCYIPLSILAHVLNFERDFGACRVALYFFCVNPADLRTILKIQFIISSEVHLDSPRPSPVKVLTIATTLTYVAHSPLVFFLQSYTSKDVLSRYSNIY